MAASNVGFSDTEQVRVRSTQRRALQLSALAVAAAEGTAEPVEILNLSERGFLMHSETEFIPGDILEINLTGTGTFDAVVVWDNAPQYGCQFETGLPKAAVSASLLRSPALKGEISRPLIRPTTPASLTDGNLHQATLSDQQEEFEAQTGLSVRAKLGVTLGLAVLAWTPIAAAATVAILRG